MRQDQAVYTAVGGNYSGIILSQIAEPARYSALLKLQRRRL